MKSIKQYMEMRELAGKIIAFRYNEKDISINKNAIEIDDFRFGIIGLFPSISKNIMGYNLQLLIPKDSFPCINTLNNNVLFDLKFKARATSVEELDKIESLISNGKAVFEYMNKTNSLNKVAKQNSMSARL